MRSARTVWGVAGDFHAINHEVVPAAEFRMHPQRLQEVADRLGEPAVVAEGPNILVLDEGEVDVAKVMEHSAAPRQPADHGDAGLFDVRLVDFLKRILVAADDDGLVVAPQHDDVVRDVRQEVFLHGQVEVRVRVLVVDEQHVSAYLSGRRSCKSRATLPDASGMIGPPCPGSMMSHGTCASLRTDSQARSMSYVMASDGAVPRHGHPRAAHRLRT